MLQRTLIYVMICVHLHLLCKAQDLPVRNIVVQDITYLNGGVQTKKGPQFKSFFNDPQNRQQLLTRLYQYVSTRWNKVLDTSATPAFHAKFGLFHDPNATIKNRLPSNVNSETGYLFLLIQASSSAAAYPPRLDNFLFQYQLRKGDKIIAEDKQPVSFLELDHPENCSAILDKGFTYLFDYETNLRRKYPKVLTSLQLEALQMKFPDFISSVMLVESYGLAMDKADSTPWHTEATRAKIIYTDRNVGSDIATGLATALLNIGTSTEKEFLQEQKVNVFNDDSKSIACTFRLAGNEVKEKERVKENGMKKVESTITRSVQIDSRTRGEWANDSDIIATYQYVNDSTLFPVLSYTASLDSIFGITPVEKSQLIYDQKLNQNNAYGIKGDWKGNPFFILYRDKNEIVYFFWNHRLAGFTLQGEYEPRLYINKQMAAPVNELCLLQLVLSKHLFKHFPFH